MTIDEADSLDDDSVILEDRPIRKIPAGSHAQIVASSEQHTFFGSVSFNEMGQEKRTVPLAVNKPVTVALSEGSVSTVRTTIAFTGKDPASVTVTTVILKKDGQRFGEPCSHEFTGSNGAVARQRVRLSVTKTSPQPVPEEV